MSDSRARLRAIPSVDALLREEGGRELLGRYPRAMVVEAFREATDRLRRCLSGAGSGAPREGDEAPWIMRRAGESLARLARRSLRRVVNATGVVLHTNLGRALLAPEALRGVVEAASAYTNLELDLEAGKRGSRHSHLVSLLGRLTGAPAALVVNNCAAAVMLVAGTLARDREVVVSRGELVEIGGSYRLPDVLAASGARLVEVGTTNRTYLSDYEKAIGEETGLLLVTHRSNFRLVGFTHRPDPAEVAALGRRRGIPTCMDLGSGLMVELEGFDEPTVPAMVEAGFDLVTFSGDKLLGGPQAGLVVGREELVGRLRAHPVTRALRVDKLAVAALEQTLRLYLDPERARARVPVLAMLGARPEELEVRARGLAGRLEAVLGERAQVEVLPGISSVGGGSLPGQELPTFLVALTPRRGSEADWEERLRAGDPPVLARCQEGKLLLDVRTLLEEDLEDLPEAVGRAVP